MLGFRLAVALLLTMVAPAAAGLPAAAPSAPPSVPSFEEVLASRCGLCHTRERIEQARRRGGDATPVLQRMEARGARLSAAERSALAAFWGNPLKEGEPRPDRGELSAYRQLIETRCRQCHPRERIDEAIARQLPLQSLEALLARRGVVLSPREAEVLKIFWGEPLR